MKHAPSESRIAGKTLHIPRRALLGGIAAFGAAGMFARSVNAAVARPANFIDTHIHPIGGEMTEVLKVDAYDRVNHPKIAQYVVDQMDMAGVSISLLSMGAEKGFADAAKQPDGARKLNDSLAAMAALHPTRLKFFACLPMPDMDACLHEVEYGTQSLGAVGVSLFTSFNDKWMGDPLYAPLFAELHRRKVAVKVHPRPSACCAIKEFPTGLMELGDDTARAISRMLLTGSAHKYSDMKIIWSHAGGALLGQLERYVGIVADDTKAAEAMPNGPDFELKRFYYDTAQAYHPATLAALKTLVPMSQIVFGTDMPHRTQLESREGVEKSGIFSAADLKAIGDSNIRRLLSLP